MNALALAIVTLFPSLGFAQKAPSVVPSSDQITFSATYEVKDGLGMKLRGSVQISSNLILIKADEADYNPLTGDLEVRGHVHISFKNATPQITIRDSDPEDQGLRPGGK